MSKLELNSAREALKAAATTLIVVGSIAEDDQELAESVSDVVVYLMSIIDALEAQPEMDPVLMEQLVNAYEEGLIDELMSGGADEG